MNDLLDRIVRDLRVRLGADLVGVYLHGSLAMGCFDAASSDVDVLVVCARPLTDGRKLELLADWVGTRDLWPRKGLEISVLVAAHCRPFVHPCPYELHLSPAWMGAYREDPRRVLPPSGATDRDLAAHVRVLLARGLTLYGRPHADVFGPVRGADYLDAVAHDIADAARDVHEDPVYAILNLCRTACFLERGAILSKREGGEAWLDRGASPHAELIREALRVYAGGDESVLRALEPQYDALVADLMAIIAPCLPPAPRNA